MPNILDRLEDLIEQGAFRFKAKEDAKRLASAIERFAGTVLSNLDPESLKEMDNINEAFNQFAKYEEQGAISE